MSSSVADTSHNRFSCNCLNILIQSATPSTPQPDSPTDPQYIHDFVGDDGITMRHPQLTLRTRMRVIPSAGSSQYSRFTTLTCLLCDLVVYRVFHTVAPDVEGKDGPILLADDWVEREILKSSNGWIQVHSDCLVGDAITRAEASPEYSSLFNVILPPSLPPPSPKANGEKTVSRDLPSTPEPTPSYFSHLRPLFSPPPFTPSHPAFLHLASLAGLRSQAHREAAEKHIAELVREKTSEIEQEEAILKQEVEALWRKFRDSVKKTQAEGHQHNTPRSPLSRSSRSRERDQRSSFAHSSTSPQYGTPLTVREFITVSVPARRANSPPPRPSALSASLASSSFHHPKATQGISSPSIGSPDSGSSKTLSTQSCSSTLVQSAVPEGVNILQFPRTVDDSINTQASHRYFVNLGEDIARKTQRRDTQAAGPSHTSSSLTPNGNEKQNSSANALKTDAYTTADESKEKTDAELFPPRGRDPKGKRKVTFDVEPDVVTIKRESETEKATQGTLTDHQDPREMIFDLEDLDDEDGKTSPRSPQFLPLLEQPVIARLTRHGKARVQNTSGLLESFSGLRPSSLPIPSHIRPIRSQPGVDSSSHNMMLPLSQSSGLLSRMNGAKSARASPPDHATSTDSNIELKTPIAADALTHHGIWNKDSRTWQILARRSGVSNTTIPEEVEGDNVDNSRLESIGEMVNSIVLTDVEEEDEEEGDNDQEPSHNDIDMTGSLPIQIQIKSRPREVLTLASYQTQPALQAQRMNEPVSSSAGKPVSSIAIRKALYAERDLSRSMDPGAMDFVAEEEEEEEEEESDSETNSEPAQGEAPATSRGRKRALKILQARSELPEAGMWRSLAS